MVYVQDYVITFLSAVPYIPFSNATSCVFILISPS